MAIDKDAIREHVRGILAALGDDPDREGLKETPDRVARMYEEVFEGMNYTNHEIAMMFNKSFKDDLCVGSDKKDIVLVRDIPIFSYCEHHIALMYDMSVSVAYIPKEKVLGLSKIARICDMVGKRLQLQERIGSDIAEIIISSKWEKMDENLDKLTAMATGVSKMVRNSVTAYVEKDLELARTVMNDDDEIDDYFDEIRDQIIQLVREADGRDGRKLFDFIMVTKYLERIGDHATNIAEWVEFAITGVHKDSAVMH